MAPKVITFNISQAKAKATAKPKATANAKATAKPKAKAKAKAKAAAKAAGAQPFRLGIAFHVGSFPPDLAAVHRWPMACFLEARSGHTIGQVKAQIQDTEGIRRIPAHEQHLTFAGQELEDDRRLSFYNIAPGSVIGMFL